MWSSFGGRGGICEPENFAAEVGGGGGSAAKSFGLSGEVLSYLNNPPSEMIVPEF
jgi:hypothetical protein